MRQNRAYRSPGIIRTSSEQVPVPVILKVDSFRREKTSHQFDGLTTNSPPKQATYRGFFSSFSRVRSTESSEVMERAMGIEPTSEAWEAPILPLNYARSLFLIVLRN